MNDQILINTPLKNYTTWKVGGEAKQLYKPGSVTDLAKFLISLPEDEPLLWLGLGSNSLIRDKGFNGTVILTQGGLNGIELIDETTVRVEAGVSCAKMARFCARNHLEGGEFWAGIPGTMGGALRMNAGCFNGETWNYVSEVTTINRQGKIIIHKPEDFEISYRTVKKLPEDEWFIDATVKLDKGNKDKSLQTIKDLLKHRALTQPTSDYNCGSVFKNPDSNYAARLIEGSGLKGFMIGNAKVSEKHANFIINHEGMASAKDIENLIKSVQEQVFNKTQVTLNCEVRIVGDK